MPVRRLCAIAYKTQVGPDTYWMSLEAGDMVEKTFRAPGQFVHIACEGKFLRRPISVCTCQSDSSNDLLSVVFEVRGEGTRWLAQRQEGDKLDVLGLLGNGFPITPGGRYLLAGGGIGAPPLYGCARSSAGSATAVLGFRSARQVILQELMTQSCKDIFLYTDDGSLGTKGYVADGVHTVLDKDSDFTAILACGPRPMLRGVAEVAQKYGLPCYVSMEERMACGVGACLGCAIQTADGSMKHVCKDGPVFDAREVVWDG